jgi:hypothetical protein
MGKCNVGGSIMDWVPKTRGVSFRLAVELLRAGHPSLAAGDGRVVRKGTTAKLPSPVTLGADDQPSGAAGRRDHQQRTQGEPRQEVRILE